MEASAVINWLAPRDTPPPKTSGADQLLKLAQDPFHSQVRFAAIRLLATNSADTRLSSWRIQSGLPWAHPLPSRSVSPSSSLYSDLILPQCTHRKSNMVIPKLLLPHSAEASSPGSLLCSGNGRQIWSRPSVSMPSCSFASPGCVGICSSP